MRVLRHRTTGLESNLPPGRSPRRWCGRVGKPRLPASTPQRLSNMVFMGMGEPMSGCLLPSHEPEHNWARYP